MTGTPEQRITNWTRDYIQYQQNKKGFCGVGEYKKTFKLFQKSYGYDGNPDDILSDLQRDGFIKLTRQRIVWLLPFQDR